MTNPPDRLDRLERLVTTIAQATVANQQQVSTAFEAIDRLAQIVDSERSRTSATLDSINASIQRQDRILDYLLRGNQNGNQPPT